MNETAILPILTHWLADPSASVALVPLLPLLAAAALALRLASGAEHGDGEEPFIARIALLAAGGALALLLLIDLAALLDRKSVV